MTLRERPPGQDTEPEVVVDAPDDARGYNDKGWSAMHVVVAVIAGLMLLAGLLWLGEIFGLIAAVLPGGADPQSAALWGAAGVVGLVLLLVLLRAARQSRRAGE